MRILFNKYSHIPWWRIFVCVRHWRLRTNSGTQPDHCYLAANWMCRQYTARQNSGDRMQPSAQYIHLVYDTVSDTSFRKVELETFIAYPTCSDIFQSSKPKLVSRFLLNRGKKDIRALTSSFWKCHWRWDRLYSENHIKLRCPPHFRLWIGNLSFKFIRGSSRFVRDDILVEMKVFLHNLCLACCSTPGIYIHKYIHIHTQLPTRICKPSIIYQGVMALACAHDETD